MSLGLDIMGGGIGASAAQAILGALDKEVIATGSTQLDAKKLRTAINVLRTVPAASGVQLPTMYDSDLVIVINRGVNDVKVYPLDTGTINDQAANQPVTVTAGTFGYFFGVGPLTCLADLGGGVSPPVTDPTWVNAEIPSGTINGVNPGFSLTQAPNAAASLQLFLNGLMMTAGIDYTLSVNLITMTTIPDIGDALIAFYRTSNGMGINFGDGQTPVGSINGSNLAFTLSFSPSPGSSLELYLNGVLQTAGIDYTLASNTITYAVAPDIGDTHVAWYRY